MRTFVAKSGDVEQRWFIVDAASKTLGRTAAEIAKVLQGKNKPTYTPHVDTGDFVVVINAEKVKLTGKKLDGKLYYRHTGWMGGLISTSAREMLKKKPEDLMKFAVKGMLPKTILGKQMFSKLKVHVGGLPEHGYKAQGAIPLEFTDK